MGGRSGFETLILRILEGNYRSERFLRPISIRFTRLAFDHDNSYHCLPR